MSCSCCVAALARTAVGCAARQHIGGCEVRVAEAREGLGYRAYCSALMIERLQGYVIIPTHACAQEAVLGRVQHTLTRTEAKTCEPCSGFTTSKRKARA